MALYPPTTKEVKALVNSERGIGMFEARRIVYRRAAKEVVRESDLSDDLKAVLDDLISGQLR